MIFGDEPVDVEATRERLARLPDVLAAAPKWVLGAWLGGSYAAGNPSPLSDVDVFLLIEPGTPRVFGVPDGWPDLEAACREALGTEEVYLGEWARPDAPGALPALAASLGTARLRRAADADVVLRFEESVFAAGRPDARECARIIWRSRARTILRGGVCYNVARRCLSLGHQAIRTLDLEVPANADGIPEVLCAAGIVRPRDAAWVLDAFACRISAVWNAGRPAADWDHEVREALQPFSERGFDFAWSVLVALERAYLDQERMCGQNLAVGSCVPDQY
jgi:hypothetical protein